MDIGELLSYKVCSADKWRERLNYLFVGNVPLFGYDELRHTSFYDMYGEM
jgi:hypothetical protein